MTPSASKAGSGAEYEADDGFEVCDFCAHEVPYDDITDCQPDDLGFCIYCGKLIEETPSHD